MSPYGEGAFEKLRLHLNPADMKENRSQAQKLSRGAEPWSEGEYLGMEKRSSEVREGRTITGTWAGGTECSMQRPAPETIRKRAYR